MLNTHPDFERGNDSENCDYYNGIFMVLTFICKNFVLHMAYQCTKIKVASLSHYRNIYMGKKFNNGDDSDHASFREDLLLSGRDLLWSTYVPNLKSVYTHYEDMNSDAIGAPTGGNSVRISRRVLV